MITTLVITAITIFLLAGVFWFGWRRSDYDHSRHTISELGEYGAADGRRVSFGLFGPVGLALLGVGVDVPDGVTRSRSVADHIALERSNA